MADSKGYITRAEEKGSVNISEDVIAAIAAAAVIEVEGVAGFSTSVGNEIVEFLGKKGTAKGASKGVKISTQDDVITIDAYVMMQYGAVLADTAREVQNAVASSVEAMTGAVVASVNVHICGIAFEKK